MEFKIYLLWTPGSFIEDMIIESRIESHLYFVINSLFTHLFSIHLFNNFSYHVFTTHLFHASMNLKMARKFMNEIEV